MASSTSAQGRLQQLSGHMAQPIATVFSAVKKAPDDPLFSLMAAYRADSSNEKCDLGIGAYRDDNGRPWILPVVKKADSIVANDASLNHEYLPIAGLAPFTLAAQKLILGASSLAIKESRVTSLQTISGTGAVHLGALLLSKMGPSDTIMVSAPTWANHNQIITNVNLKVQNYPYFDKKTKGLDIEGMLSALKAASAGTVVLLHACAHNPTGVDPSKEQWKQIAEVMRSKKLFPFFDCAYQGFASGSLDQDAWAVRYFVEQGFEMLIAQSFAKNFGLYGERAGAMHYLTGPGPEARDITTRVASQLAVLQRSEISNPPAYGARIASCILNNRDLFEQWEEDLRTMSGRIIDMRKALRAELERLCTPGTWKHITDQIGMFSFTGLSEPQVKALRERYHVYMTNNGRISMAGLNTKNVSYFARAVDAVVRKTS